MRLSVPFVLVVAALICTVLSAIGQCPLWVAVLLLVVAQPFPDLLRVKKGPG